MKKVRDGYKMTEVGEIPNEWKVKRLGEIAEINPKKEIVDDNNLVSFIAMEDISNSGRVINKNDKLYGEVKKGYTGFKNNDVLLAKITPCFENGKRALVKDLSNGIGFGSTEFHVLRETKESRAKYLYYVIGSHKFISKAENNMTGSAGQKRVPTEFVKDYVLAMPTIEEQEKIASILSTVDEQIDNIDGLIEKNKELKKGLMQQLLTKGIGHTKFKKTEIGEIPEAWEVRRIGDVAKFQGGYAFKSSDYIDNGINLVKITNVQQKDLIWSDTNFLPKEFLDKYSEYRLNVYGVVIAMTRPIISSGIKVCKVKEIDIPALLNQRVGRFICSDKVSGKYLYQYCFSDYFINKVGELCSTTGQPNISSNQIESIMISLPSITEQEKIESILSEVDEKIEEYENKKQKLEELKKGLMQQLLTGKIRVKQ